MDSREIYSGALLRIPLHGGGTCDCYVVETKDGRVTFARTRGSRARWWLPYEFVVEKAVLVRRAPDDDRPRSQPRPNQ